MWIDLSWKKPCLSLACTMCPLLEGDASPLSSLICFRCTTTHP